MTHVLIDNVALIAIYSIVILGLGFISGMAGIYSICQAGFFAVGAFTYSGLYSFEQSTDLLVALAVAAAIGALLSVLLALVALRVSGEAFVVTSFGIQIVLIAVLYNWDKISGGPSGVYGLPTATIAGYELATPLQNMFAIVVFAVAIFFMAWWIRRAPFGRLVRAMGVEESAVQAAGFRPTTLKLSAFVVGGTLAAVAGVWYSSYLGIAQTTDFDVNVSITLLAAVMVGGANTLTGPIIGAFLFISLPRLLTLWDTPTSAAGPLQELVFGILLTLIMLFSPGGVASLGRAGVWRNLRNGVSRRKEKPKRDEKLEVVS